MSFLDDAKKQAGEFIEDAKETAGDLVEDAKTGQLGGTPDAVINKVKERASEHFGKNDNDPETHADK